MSYSNSTPVEGEGPSGENTLLSHMVDEIYRDAVANPEKLLSVDEVWDEDWTALLEGVDPDF